MLALAARMILYFSRKIAVVIKELDPPPPPESAEFDSSKNF